jgi:preprotein translocase SecE subunit
MTFLTAALLLWVISASFIAGVLDMTYPEWDLALIGNEFRLSDLLGIGIGIFGGVYLWRHERLFQLANEVAFEVRKVTWPGLDETRLQTIVTVVVTIFIALCLWAFDVMFSALTKLFYNI